MKRHEVDQGSEAWLKLRLRVPTASEADNLLTPEFELRKGEMPKSYIYSKLADSWRGHLSIAGSSFDMDQGHVLEEEAQPFFQLETGRKICSVGFITTDDERAGCSPDGLIVGEECGLEIKCPRASTHVKYLMGGVVPKEYRTQVHFSMYVTGYPQWVFMSYCRKFPPLIVTVKRHEEIMTRIAAAVDTFHKEFSGAMERIKSIQASYSA